MNELERTYITQRLNARSYDFDYMGRIRVYNRNGSGFNETANQLISKLRRILLPFGKQLIYYGVKEKWRME